MATIAEIAQRSQAYIDNLSNNIDGAIYSVEQELVDLNRKQLLLNKGADDKPLINIRTGSEFLSKAYAKKMKKSKPDLFVRGDFQEGMRLITKFAAKVYTVFSYHNLEKYLSVQYKNYPGIAPKNQKKAQEITGNAIAKDFKNKVFK
jgi:hypothetical protein